MKALRTTLAAVILLVGAMTVNAQSMSIAAMRSNARFLTDRMAYTLGIRDPFIIDEIYRINYDYIWGVNEYLDDVALGYYYDDYMAVVAARDAALRNLLGISVWNRLTGYSYFYRPIVFVNRGWHFSIYDYDRYGVNRYYYHAPRPLVTYSGGHFFRPMAPRGGRVVHPAPGGVYRGNVNRGDRVDNGPRPNAGGVYRGNMNRNVNVNNNVNVNRNVNVNQTEVRPNGNVNNNAGGMRSGSNMNSSSRFNGSTTTTRTTTTTATPSAPRSMGNMGARSSAGASVNRGSNMGTRSSAGASVNRGGASMGTGGGGAAVGGRTGGGRR